MIGLVATAAVRPRPIWSSQRAYLVSAITGVVGLGAIWRFPYLVGAHGGGAFVVAYLVCMSLIALPLAIVESSAGRMAGVSAVGVFRSALGPAGTAFGWLVVAVAVLLMSYYYVVTGWTLGYFAGALRGDIQVFREFSAGYAPLAWFLVVGFLVYLVLLRGVATLERASRYLLALLAVALVWLAVYAQSTSGAREAADFYLTIDLGRLSEGATWRAAAGQAFYQSGVGHGFLIAYASFSPPGMNLAKTSLIMAAANVVVALTAMLVVFPIIFSFGLAPDSGAQLAFTAFPRILGSMQGGGIVGVAFFGLLWVAAFTSCLAGTAVPIAAATDEWGLDRRVAAAGVVGVILLLGVPSALSHSAAHWTIAGEPVLDRIDTLAGSGLVIGIGLVSSEVIAWRVRMLSLVRAMRFRGVQIGPFRATATRLVWFSRVAAPLLLLLVARPLLP